MGVQRQTVSLNFSGQPVARGQQAPDKPRLDQALGDGRYVRQTQTDTWTLPTGTFSRTTFASYSAPTISATYTQAEVQALADHVQVLSRTLAALISDLKTNKTLT